MAAKTKAELSEDVLRKLGILDSLHSPSAEDAAYVEDQYDHKLSELKDKGLVYWPNTNRTTAEIPAAIYGALVGIMIDDVASAFGAKPDPDYDDNGRPLSPGVKGLKDLRRHMAKGPSGEPTRAVYY